MIRKCIVCEKEINVFMERIGKSNGKARTNRSGKSRETTTSHEGVRFLNKWFCNNCWEAICK